MPSDVQLSLFAPKWSLPPFRAPATPAPSPPYTDPFLFYHARTLEAAGQQPLTFDAESWDYSARGAIGLDVETYDNFFVICLKRFADGKKLVFERSRRCDFEPSDLARALYGNTAITFNGSSYDLPMIAAAARGAVNSALMRLSVKLVEDPRSTSEEKPRFDHIDLMNPNPSVRQGLKMIAARLHCRFVVDLPYKVGAILTPEQMNIVTLYCFNDIDATESLYRALREPLEMRVAIGKRLGGADLRSRSDAQVGETIVRRRIEEGQRRRIRKPEGSATRSFCYIPPPWLKYEDPQLKEILSVVLNTQFSVIGSGKVLLPPSLENRIVHYGKSIYRMGIGGLHSSEAHRALFSDDNTQLIDADVASQYPNIILQLGMSPPAIGPAFLKIYAEIIKERLAAKAAGDKVRADGGRIATNGVYGKLGSPYSFLYSPQMMIATTLTGQLSILMLIERAEAAGIEVVSANTDGVVFLCPRCLGEALESVVSSWQSETGLVLERTPYKAIYNSSVNTYIAIKEDGKIKRKGWIADPWRENDLRGQMMKNPAMTICSEAVVRLVTDGIPIEKTVRSSTDPRDFITVIKVKDGGEWRGYPLGRVVRYYWSIDGAPIMTENGRRRVPKTEGARPMQELLEILPPDLDYIRYCEEAYRLAEDLGVKDIR